MTMQKPVIDEQSDTWAAVLAFVAERRIEARAIVDGQNVPEREADFQRGVIAFISEIVALPVIPPRIRVAQTVRR